MTIVTIATLFPLEDRREDIVSAMTAAAERVHAEIEGCKMYALLENDDELVVIAKWADSEALAEYTEGDILESLRPSILGNVRRPPETAAGSESERPGRVQTLSPHPTGEGEKGEL